MATRDSRCNHSLIGNNEAQPSTSRGPPTYVSTVVSKACLSIWDRWLFYISSDANGHECVALATNCRKMARGEYFIPALPTYLGFHPCSGFYHPPLSFSSHSLSLSIFTRAGFAPRILIAARLFFPPSVYQNLTGNGSWVSSIPTGELVCHSSGSYGTL